MGDPHLSSIEKSYRVGLAWLRSRRLTTCNCDLARSKSQGFPGDADNWCRSLGALAISMSVGFDNSPGGTRGVDWKQDWVSYVAPWTLYVTSAGNTGQDGPTYDTVGNRNYNGLVLGGIDDRDTPSRSDSIVYADGSWRNPVSPHNDWELPELSAPAVNVDAVGIVGQNGTSATPPQVAGTVALMNQRDSRFHSDPEMAKAVLIATADSPTGEGTLTHLGGGAGDWHSGAGALDSYVATYLAGTTFFHSPPQRSQYGGRWGHWVNFSSEFDSNGYWTYDFGTTQISWSNLRLRGVIVWDATPAGCDSQGNNCTGSILEGDLDLSVLDETTGGTIATSNSYDSNWEMVDIPLTQGHSYKFSVKKYQTAAAGTYLGLAWYVYPPVT
jgi:hypothetical protein